MSLRLGDTAPDFVAETTNGIIQFHKWIGNSWAILFSHPGDYTPVCTTELGALAKLEKEFIDRNTKVIAISIDSLHAHRGWIYDINETQNTKVNFPIIADTHKRVAHLYDMIHPFNSKDATVRSVFIIGPDKRIKLMLTYPASTGRNFAEIIRVIDSLQLTDTHNVATPANWEKGQDCVILNSVPTNEIALKFPKGHTALRTYLRVTPQPNI